jgi:predicted MFS family arabinose efflux permease
LRTQRGNGLVPAVEKQELIRFSGDRSQAEEWLVIFLVGCAFFATVSVNYVISPVLPTIAQAFDVSVSKAALLVSTYALFYACFAVLLGPTSDYIERKLMMTCSLSAFAVMTFLCGVARDFNWLLISRAGAGIAAAALQPATWAYLADYFPYERRGTATAWVMQAGSLALILGVPLGGLISQFLSWRWVFVLAALMAIVVAVTIVLKLPSLTADTKAGPNWHKGLLSAVGETFGSLISRRSSRAALLVSFLIWFGFFGQYTYVGALLRDRFGLDSARIGFATLAVGVGYILGGQLGGRLTDRIGPKKVILCGLGWLTLSLALLPNVSQPMLAVLAIFGMGFGFFFAYSAQITLITELIPRARSTMMSVNYFCTYIGLTAGSATGSLILVWSGFPGVGLMSAASCVLASIVVLVFVSTDRRATAAAASEGGPGYPNPEP